MKGVLRVPEVLRVSPGILEAKVLYYTGAQRCCPPASLPSSSFVPRAALHAAMLHPCSPLLRALYTCYPGAGKLGLSKREVGAMYARDPGTLLTSLAHIQEVAAWLG